MAEIMQRDVKVLAGMAPSPEEEHILFTQMHYARHKIKQLRRKLLRAPRWSRSEILELLQWNQKQLNSRSQIITSNMGLVLAMAKRVTYYNVEYTDLISEGSMALMRATEKFDIQRGFKFSTYAWQAIFKSFSRVAKKNYRYRNLFPAQLESEMEKVDYLNQKREESLQDKAEEVGAILQDNLAELTLTERSVVEMRFSLNRSKSTESQTLKQVGEKLGLSKERIRQIQKNALTKLREVAEQRMIAI